MTDSIYNIIKDDDILYAVYSIFDGEDMPLKILIYIDGYEGKYSLKILI